MLTETNMGLGPDVNTLKRPILPVALDVCGGDGGPQVAIEAARKAIARGVPIVLVGPQAICQPTGIPWESAEDVVPMGTEDPAYTVRQMKYCAHRIGPHLVKNGQACAYVSAGDTGATLAGAMLGLRKLKGFRRATVGVAYPNRSGTPTVVVDSGANVDCPPELLVQFAEIAVTYVKGRFGATNPRLGQLTIGTEPGKGNKLTKELKPLLVELCRRLGIEYVGNFEAKQLLHNNDVDVLVCDGHEGNIALKGNEGGASNVINDILEVMYRNDTNKAAGRIIQDDLLEALSLYDPNTYGGMMLLGVDGIVMIVHGSASDEGIAKACEEAARLYQSDIIGQLKAALGAMPVENIEASSCSTEHLTERA